MCKWQIKCLPPSKSKSEIVTRLSVCELQRGMPAVPLVSGRGSDSRV